MLHVGPLSGSHQATCPQNTTQNDPDFGLTECNWTTSYPLTVPASWTTGAYVVKLKRTAKVNGKAVKAKLSKAMKSGQGAIRLTSKVGGKRLVAGTYRISVRATNAAGSSAVTTVKLKVLK
jgi:hypothetical protein